ncbi:MAG: DUF4331 domain-containing protein [Thermoanaerobaculia bacterium]
MFSRKRCVLAVAAAAALVALPVAASSHREAPWIAGHPRVDGTDFYMFRSYEAGRDGYVTLIANYVPLQDAYGGPNFFSLDPQARYRIHIDNSGDGVEDLTFEFHFTDFNNDIALPIGGENVSIPLLAAGQLAAIPGGLAAQNQVELYTVSLKRGAVGNPTSTVQAVNGKNGGGFFCRPLDNAGQKTFPDYDSYAALCMDPIQIPGCGEGRVFVGQRKDAFEVNLGEVFDLVNIANPVGAPDVEPSALSDKNVTEIALELPISCLTEGRGDVIGGWSTAALPRISELASSPSFEAPEAARSTDFIQVSRLGMPLVNEVVIGLRDKNRFNNSQPADDLQFASYVTNPVLPALLEILFGVQAPTNFPRTDLLGAFILGIPGLNEFGFGEMARLNTAIPPTPRDQQNRLGVLGGDNAGFPNGRRPGDDTTDAELRVAMGVLCHAFPGLYCSPGDAASGDLPYTDGTLVDASQTDDHFPYLRTPIPGSPNGVNGIGEP